MRFSVVLLIALMAIVGRLVAPAPIDAAGPRATATIIDTAGNVVGTASFAERRDGRVQVRVRVDGLTPGAHGIHIHAVGACALGTTPAFSSAGGHFNPSGGLHGAHAGDLGNITASAHGLGRLVLMTDQFTLSAGPSSLLDADGSAIVIHANPDDLVTDPSGNSGGRVACGEIAA